MISVPAFCRIFRFHRQAVAVSVPVTGDIIAGTAISRCQPFISTQFVADSIASNQFTFSTGRLSPLKLLGLFPIISRHSFCIFHLLISIAHKPETAAAATV
jgi:hypothetical protein